MKRKGLLKTLLLLCALVVGSGSVWAEDETATFDFDNNGGTDFGYANDALSSSSSTAGDITSNVEATINGVTVTITPSGGSTANRFWNSSPKLRLYGGTMTVSAGSNTIKSIAFTTGSGKWNSGNTASVGSVSGEKTSYTWSGSASSIEFTIAGNTQIKSFVVTYEITSSKTATTTTITPNITNTDLRNGTAAGSLSANVTVTAGGSTVTGATVTWSSGDTGVATIDEDGVVTLVGPGTTTITASYAGNDTYAPSSGTYDLTVAGQVNPVTIQMTNSLFGEEVHTSGTASEDHTYIGTKDNVKVSYFVPKGSYYYFNTSNVRPYNTCTLTYEAPAGFAITMIEFTSDGSNWNDATPSAGSMTSTKKWEGFAKSVTFSWETSGTRIKTVVFTLAEEEEISVSDAGFATYVSDADLDYTSVSGLKAYRATVSGTAITFTKVTTVPAGEGVLLQGDEDTYYVPVAATSVAAWDADDNAFVRGEDAEVATGTGPYNYILNNVDGVVGFYKANGQTVATNRAYLQSSTSAARIAIDLEDEVSGISTMYNEESTTNGVYDLQGRRVAQPTKGLYIMNGKKVIFK